MIIQLLSSCTETNRQVIESELQLHGYKTSYVNTTAGSYLVCIGINPIDLRTVGVLSGVKDVHRVTDSYKLVSAKWKVSPTVIDLGDDITVGGKDFVCMAGPCSIETEEQVIAIVKHLKKQKIRIMRGGVFKPRSSPYAFRGLGIAGLKMFYQHAHSNGIKIITEVMQVSQIEEMYPYVDIFQVGARNSQNFNLLDELGRTSKPVLIKRAISGTIDELLHSAEYIFARGNEKLILCERGIRTYENAYRNTFDINAISILKEKSHLPVIADPSHGVGIRQHVSAVALAAVVAGADGIIYEVHENPEEALSDGQQTLNFSESAHLIEKIKKIRELDLV